MRGEGRGGKALEGRDGEPALAACPCSARALARPTAACGPEQLLGLEVRCSGPVLGKGEGSREREETGSPRMG